MRSSQTSGGIHGIPRPDETRRDGSTGRWQQNKPCAGRRYSQNAAAAATTRVPIKTSDRANAGTLRPLHPPAVVRRLASRSRCTRRQRQQLLSRCRSMQLPWCCTLATTRTSDSFSSCCCCCCPLAVFFESDWPWSCGGVVRRHVSTSTH